MAHKNTYETAGSAPQQESERLRAFDLPTSVSIEAIGPLPKESVVLDIGAGENPGLRNYTLESEAHYVPLDIRPEPLMEHQRYDTAPLLLDARDLSSVPSIVDVVHSRFVLGHFNPADRQKVVDESLKTLKPGGKAVFIDYDWTAMHGSEAVNRLRDFNLNEITIFDAGFGATSTEEISQIVGNTVKSIETKRTSPPVQTDYRPMLALRQITLRGLAAQNAPEEKVKEAESIFDDLELEAKSPHSLGFFMPDMVAVILYK